MKGDTRASAREGKGSGGITTPTVERVAASDAKKTEGAGRGAANNERR